MNNDIQTQFQEIIKEIVERNRDWQTIEKKISHYLLDNGHWDIKKILTLPQETFKDFIDLIQCSEYIDIFGRNFEEDHPNIKFMRNIVDELFEMDFQNIPHHQRKTAVNCMIIDLCHSVFVYKLQITYYKYHNVEYYTDELLITFMSWIDKIIRGILLTDFSVMDQKQLLNKIGDIITK